MAVAQARRGPTRFGHVPMALPFTLVGPTVLPSSAFLTERHAYGVGINHTKLK